MRITDVRIRLVPNDSKLKAVASVTFDDEFVVHDIKIIDGQNGKFLAMPSRKISDGEYRDVAHPLTPETRSYIRDAVFVKYEEALGAQAMDGMPTAREDEE
ncbi:MAG: septation regulator SpoVG [Clostridiales bacterium]|nr:septation regulator SpoVG [Clostridiales bacterium]